MNAERFGIALLALAATMALPASAAAHIGSPDVFLDGQAGPYRLFVTVRPPHVIPGVADVEIETRASNIREIRIVPLPLTGPGAEFAPAADLAARSPDDPGRFTGHLWMMTAGAWQVRITASGDQGSGSLSVPVPTLPQSTLAMTRTLRATLFCLMLVLAVGVVTIASAMAREAHLDPGTAPNRAARRRGRIAGGLALGAVLVALLGGNRWWAAEASNYARIVYKPLELGSSVTPDGRLRLALRDPGWIRTRRLDDFIDDHHHVMHLFVVSPALDRLWHLHPDEIATGMFEQRLPETPAGHYQLFADVVHGTGVSETVTAELDTAAITGAPLGGDDSAWSASTVLSDNGRIVWVRDAQPLATKQLTMFTFRVEDRNGQPATDLEPYMGMSGHAIFIRRDRRVFAHVHPSGSAPMAAMDLGQRSLGARAATALPQSHAHDVPLPAIVSFPYGLPEPGDYRIFVQVKRHGQIETGVFDARVN